MTKNYTPHETEISYLQADVNYTIFHLSDGKKIVSSFTLKKYENDSRLSGFLRVSKSYLVNPDFIENIAKEGKKAKVTLLSGKEILVSRRKKYLVEKI